MKEKIMNKLKEVGRHIKKCVTDPEWWINVFAYVLWTMLVSAVSYIVGAIVGVNIVKNTPHISDEDITKGDKIEAFYDATNEVYHCKRKPKD